MARKGELDPVSLAGMMMLESGHRWGEVATDEQWADMLAVLEPDGGPRWHFWLRSRGRSKTTDAGVAALALMLSGRILPGDEMYAVAAARKQAGLLANKMLAISRNTPEFAGAVDVQQFSVIALRTGAVLEVASSELAGSWGGTPRFAFIDEICNHDNTEKTEQFIDAYITALPKRPDSVCLIGSTPSSATHFAYRLWCHAVQAPLWRASVVSGPAPWQSQAELDDTRARLPDYMWQRLFECRWASADDALADAEALADCTRAEGFLPPAASAEYVVTWDIGWRENHSAVVVAHLGERGGRKTVIIDRLESWVPRPGREVKIGDVMGYAADMSREYNGAPLYGDPHEAWQTIQDMKAAGYLIRPADVTARANSTGAQLLLRLIRDRTISLPDDEIMRQEFLSLRLVEGNTPGIVRLASDGTARGKGHWDRVTAIIYAVTELLNRPGQSWRDYCGTTRRCRSCGQVTLAAARECTICHASSPDVPPPGQAPAAAREGIQPGGFLAAYLGDSAVRCTEGHPYDAARHPASCPVCARTTGTSPGVPAAFTRALQYGIRR